MKNLVSRYYLTRELFKLRQMSDELLEAMRLVEQIPPFQRHKEATREFFLERAAEISFSIKYLTDMIDRLAGDSE